MLLTRDHNSVGGGKMTIKSLPPWTSRNTTDIEVMHPQGATSQCFENKIRDWRKHVGVQFLVG